ncbi:Uncharacterized conserved protein YlxW, UPF0749 family [Tessaracoccus bendigoensis DSM 12906]|uniref:Uncharacterized conserved protein YlxW, UPF0749 family n=1 Tax=Tessaracoccus bendigoensis DSM 12906 TaxID=1123357 RepID=A0A1M6L5V4_9ACTN|nr:DUF881 domain-containing protein [Tessaracoccus bendigoensis]SHJ66494.1 Uncharacterized conserved protein YlxW, UPF0749 family [Tessaracoccus bendigoensis DSM 12906]
MNLWERLRARIPRVRANMGRNQERHRSPKGRIATVLVCVLAGLMITVSAIAARGTDLRSDRSANLRDVIVTQGERNAELRSQAQELGEEVASLTTAQPGGEDLTDAVNSAEFDAGLVAVTGPGLRVTLTDAPPDFRPAGVDDDALVVHQQDIQAVANALWAGGAEAMTIQGQRVISTTGIKCVGNSVVLHGIPYAPPYVIEAIGDVDELQRGLDESPAIEIYRQYVEAYGLGYTVETSDTLDLAAFGGAVGLRYATKG